MIKRHRDNTPPLGITIDIKRSFCFDNRLYRTDSKLCNQLYTIDKYTITKIDRTKFNHNQ